MTAAGSVSDYDAAKQAELEASMAATLGVAPADVTVAVTAASVRLIFSVVVTDTSVFAVAVTASAALAEASMASSALGIDVLTVSVAVAVDGAISSPPASPSLPSPPRPPLPPPPVVLPPTTPPPLASPSAPTPPPAVAGLGGTEDGITSESSGGTDLIPLVVPLAVVALLAVLVLAVLFRRWRVAVQRMALRRSPAARPTHKPDPEGEAGFSEAELQPTTLPLPIKPQQARPPHYVAATLVKPEVRARV